MNATEITITGRTKIGFSWTNQAVQVWNSDYTRSSLQIAEPANEPSEMGTFNQVMKEHEIVSRNNSGNYWRCRWFAKVDGSWVEIDAPYDNRVGNDRINIRVQIKG